MSALLALANQTFGATYYVDGDLWTGVESGTGSESDPFTSFASAAAALANGDVIRCAGAFSMANGVGVEISDLAGFRIEQWPGRSQAIFDAGVPLASGSFVAAGGGRFVIDIGPERDVTGVTEDYGPLSAEDPRFAGHLQPVASVNFVESVPMSWHYDSASGLLHVHPVGSADPATSGAILELLTATDGIRVSRCTDFEIRGLEFRRTSDNGSEGYGVNALSCEGGLLREIRVIDAGAHSLGFSGLVNANNRIEECEFFGLQGGPAGQNHVVFFANNESIRGGVCDSSEFHLYGSLRPDGAPVDGSRVIIGAFQHTGAAAQIEPEGVIWKNCLFIGYDDHESRPWGGGPTGMTAPANPLDVDQHGIILRDCVATNCTGLAAVGDYATVFFDRCVFDFSRRSAAPAGVRLGVVQTAIRLGDPGGPTTPVFRSCVIVADAPPGASAGALFGLQAETDLSLILSTVHWKSAAASHAVIRAGASPPGGLHLQKNVLHRDTPGALLSGVSIAVEEISAPGPNWYAGVTSYAPSGPLSTESGWGASVDPEGVYNVDPGFAAPETLDYAAPPGHAIRDTLWHDASLVSLRGVRKRSYDDHYGAVQYGARACLADLTDDDVVDGGDLATLLAQWSGSGEGDLTGDGIVDGADLAVLLAAWGDCDDAD